MTNPITPANLDHDQLQLTPRSRSLLDIQGFEDVDDSVLARTSPWLRFAPAMCAIVAAVGIVAGSPPILWSLAVIAALGALLPFHPFDLIYTLIVRPRMGGTALPVNRAPRRFACAMGSVWLVVTGLLFVGGYALAAIVFGFAFVGVAALGAATHVCLPSIMFRTSCGQFAYVRARLV